MSKKVWEIIELLEKNGWHYVRTNGDHRKYAKTGCALHIIVSGKLSDDMPEGTYRAILRKAGLK